jgi:hypothetical protein
MFASLLIVALAGAGLRDCPCHCPCPRCGPYSPPAFVPYQAPLATAADYEADAARWLEIGRRMDERGERLLRMGGREYLVRDSDYVGPPRPR